MKNITSIITALFIAGPLFLFSQITVDSLIGTYAGNHWFKWEEDNEWTITNDTVYITDINGNNCRMIAIANHEWMGGIWVGYETAYDFCYGNSYNWFSRFYELDSLKIIMEDVSLPPPNYHVSSTRFFGKKISSDILIHTIDKKAESIKVFPNPFNNQLSIDWGVLSANNIYNLQLLDINGNRIMVYEQLKGERFLIDTKSINSGVYFLQLSSEEIFKTFKLIKI